MSKKGRRKRPGRHTVHPTHSRYNVSSYPRGKGSLVAQYEAPKTQSRSEIAIKYSGNIQSLKRMKKQARVSPDLKEAIDETIKALERGDVELAYELSAVKSLICGGMDVDPKVNHFREDNDYNEKKLGYSVYRELDGIHHDLASDVGRMPSGMTVITSRGIVERKKPTRRHRTLTLMRKEHEAIRRRPRL